MQLVSYFVFISFCYHQGGRGCTQSHQHSVVWLLRRHLWGTVALLEHRNLNRENLVLNSLAAVSKLGVFVHNIFL